MIIEKFINITSTIPVTDEMFDYFIRAIETNKLAFGGGYDGDQKGLTIEGSVYLHEQEDVSPMQALFGALSSLPWVSAVEIRDFREEDFN